MTLLRELLPLDKAVSRPSQSSHNPPISPEERANFHNRPATITGLEQADHHDGAVCVLVSIHLDPALHNGQKHTYQTRYFFRPEDVPEYHAIVDGHGFILFGEDGIAPFRDALRSGTAVPLKVIHTHPTDPANIAFRDGQWTYRAE